MENKETIKRLCMRFNLGDEKIYIYGNTIDELIESIKELGNCSIILQFIEKFQNLSKEQWEKLDKIVLNIKDASAIYKYLKKRKDNNNKITKISEFEDAIIAGGKVEYIYKLAKDVPEADIYKLLKASIAIAGGIKFRYGDNEKYLRAYINYFTRNITRVDLSKFQDAIVSSGNPRYINECNCYFLQLIKERRIILDISKSIDALIATGFLEEIYHVAKSYVEGVYITKLQDAVIASGDAEYIYYFADVEGADISKLQDALIASGNVEYIFCFAAEEGGADISKLQDIIIASGDAEYIYCFARDIEEADISKLQDAIIASENIEYIYYFATDVKGANISKLQDAIIASKNIEYIYKFATNVKGADISKLQDAIIESKNIEYIYKFAMNVEGVLHKVNKAVKQTKDFELIREYKKLIGKRFLF